MSSKVVYHINQSFINSTLTSLTILNWSQIRQINDNTFHRIFFKPNTLDLDKIHWICAYINNSYCHFGSSQTDIPPVKLAACSHLRGSFSTWDIQILQFYKSCCFFILCRYASETLFVNFLFSIFHFSLTVILLSIFLL